MPLSDFKISINSVFCRQESSVITQYGKSAKIANKTLNKYAKVAHGSLGLRLFLSVNMRL